MGGWRTFVQSSEWSEWVRWTSGEGDFQAVRTAKALWQNHSPKIQTYLCYSKNIEFTIPRPEDRAHLYFLPAALAEADQTISETQIPEVPPKWINLFPWPGSGQPWPVWDQEPLIWTEVQGQPSRHSISLSRWVCWPNGTHPYLFKLPSSSSCLTAACISQVGMP